MLNKLKKIKDQKSSEKGFTIIEVMIVLAIAGLIILIVFLAVPALERSSRNTQRKSDIGRIGSAAQTVIDNNNGTVPAATLFAQDIENEVGSLSYYPTNASTAGTLTVAGAATGTVQNNTNKDTIIIYTDATCAAYSGPPAKPVKGTTPNAQPGEGATSTGASAKQIAITYSTEGGGGDIPACTDQ